MNKYFLAHFARADGKSGSQFYTPSNVVCAMVNMLAPYTGRVYDPCWGSGCMFVRREKFIEPHSAKLLDISIDGQESYCDTWRLSTLNLAILGIDMQIGHGEMLYNDKPPDLKDDRRLVYGARPASDAGYVRVQPFIHHLPPMASPSSWPVWPPSAARYSIHQFDA